MNSSLLCKILFLPFFINVAASFETCPESVPYNSCACIEAFGKVFVLCVGTSEIDLNATLAALHGRHITRLNIKDSSIQYIPSGPLSRINLTKITIENTKIRYLFDKPLQGAITGSLDTVEIRNTVFSVGLDWSTFEGVKNLREVTVANTELQGVFEAIKFLEPQVETLRLTEDELEYIHPTAFGGLKGLRHLLLGGNKLQDFTRSMLPLPTSNIELIDLNKNQLTSLPKDIFDGMPKLNSLVLRGNSFTVLETDYMQKIWNQIFFFDASDNPLVCSCELSWLNAERRPFHLFGGCFEMGTGSAKELKELEAEYFQRC